MLGADENKSTGKSGQRNRKAQSRKVKQRSPKPDQQQDPKPNQLQDVQEEIGPPAGSIDLPPTETSIIDTTSPSGPVDSAEVLPVGFHTIAKAYGDYTRKSHELTRSFFEKLARERSFATAFDLQIEFARKAYETFAADSQKIRELHSELARQRLRSLESFMDKMTIIALSRSVSR